MSDSLLNNNYRELLARNLERPKPPGGPVIRWFTFAWDSESEALVDFAKADIQWPFLCNSMYIDNTGNSSPITVTQLITETDGINYPVANNVVAMRTAAAVTPFRLKLVTTSAAGQITRLTLFNFPLATF